jgi:hypothetical protein
MLDHQRRIVDGRTPAIVPVLPTDQRPAFGLDTDRVSTRVWERYGPGGQSRTGVTLPGLWGALEDAKPCTTSGWRGIDHEDGCTYQLAPNAIGGLSLIDAHEPR